MSEENEAEDRKESLMFITVLMKYLEQNDPEKHALAKREIIQCYERNKVGDPEYQPLHKAVKTRLKVTVGDEYWRKAVTVGDEYWRKAQSYLDLFFKKKQHDELLFKQPESSHLGDCPICFLPLPLDPSKCTLKGCCSKMICRGCDYANKAREDEMRLVQSCPFCREPAPITDEEWDEQVMKRAEANDPVAMSREGGKQLKKGDYHSAFEYWEKAAELGDALAHVCLARLYRLGRGVEKDRAKETYHLEKAAIAGHPSARHDLGAHEYNDGNVERAVKHWVIAATQGEDKSIKTLMIAFKAGLVSKDELAAALRAHKAAADATKSPQREAVEVFYKVEEFCRDYMGLGGLVNDEGRSVQQNHTTVSL